MVPYSTTFENALDRQIRDVGLCRIDIQFYDNSTYTISQYKVESFEVRMANDPLSRRFPEEIATLTLIDYEQAWHPDSPDTMMGKLERPATAKFQFGIMVNGTAVWGPFCTMFIQEKPVWNNYRATFQFVSRLCSLSGTFYQFEDGVYSLETLMDDVLAVAGDGGYHSYDARLHDFTIVNDAVLPICSVRDALLTIASAAVTSLLTDYQGYIRVVDRYSLSVVKNPAIVRLNDMYERPVAQRLPLIRNEIVNYRRKNDAEIDEETVLEYTSDVLPDGSEDQFLAFSEPIRIDTIAYGTFGETNIDSGVYRLYKTGLAPVFITRINDSLPYTIIARAQPARPRIETFTTLIDANGTEDDTFDNELVCLPSPGYQGQLRGDYLKNTRNLYTFRYRGDPSIEPLDLIRVELPFVGVCTCIVLESTFKFGNGFSGTLTVRKLDTTTAAQEFTTAVSSEAVSDEAVSDDDGT